VPNYTSVRGTVVIAEEAGVCTLEDVTKTV
jgi:hypothetical protein